SLLYSYTWFDYNDKASYDIGEVLGGTFQYQYNDQSYALFSPQSTDINSYAAWQAFFETVGQANTAIQNITTYAGPAVTPAIKKYAIAECRFMRSLAYRYLVMNWGPVPIITDNQAILTSASLRPNTTQSVWRFVINEMLAAVKDLPATPYETGRLTKWSAEGMLARYYLTYAGVQGSGGARNSTFLDSAMYYANDVIQNSGKS